MKVKVTYKGKMDEELDRKIRTSLEDAGLVWYAQGYDFVDKVRDISFDKSERKSCS